MVVLWLSYFMAYYDVWLVSNFNLWVVIVIGVPNKPLIKPSLKPGTRSQFY